MDFATMKQVAPAKVAGPTQALRLADVSEVFVGALLNEALHKIERAAMWKWSEAESSLTVLQGTQVPTVQPADLALPLMARNVGTRRDLAFHDDRQRFNYHDDPTSQRTGRIESYSIYDGTLRFYPVASQEETVAFRYYRSWPDLSADGDTPPFPETWHDLLTTYAAAKLALRLQPVAGKYLPESAARPFQEEWEQGLYAMTQSDLALTTFDAVEQHDLQESMWAGEGADW